MITKKVLKQLMFWKYKLVRFSDGSFAARMGSIFGYRYLDLHYPLATPWFTAKSWCRGSHTKVMEAMLRVEEGKKQTSLNKEKGVEV